MTVRAVVVGIERYAQKDWDVESPAANALAIVGRLLKIDVLPADIHLFLAPLEKDPAADVRARGVDVRDASWTTIDSFLRDELSKACTIGTRLLFYWSGHGMTMGRGDRVLFCSDYSERLNNRALNASLFFRWLRRDVFPGVDETIALLDVCGVQNVKRVQPTEYDADEGKPRLVPQLVYYASPEGQYAVAQSKIGVFTEAALDILKQTPFLPDEATFSWELDQYLEALDVRRFRLAVRNETDDMPERIVGRRRGGAAPHIAALIDQLLRADASEAVFQAQYAATVGQLGNEGLKGAQGVTGMVEELASLPAASGGVSRGLIQFLLRLCKEEVLAPIVGTWLLQHALRGEVKTVEELLKGDTDRKLLIVRLEVDRVGRLAALNPYLRNRNFSLVRGRRFERKAVTTWDELGEAIVGLLEELNRDRLADNLEVHFIAEPTVFDLPFHWLPSLTSGIPLGSKYVVLVHDPERICVPDSSVKESWRDQARELAKCKPSALTWAELAAAGELPAKASLWSVGFPLPHGAGRREQKLRLLELVNYGAPFVYWAHDETHDQLAQEFRVMVAELEALESVPEKLRFKRASGAKYARLGSLLWDEPSFDPFTSAVGVVLE